MAKMDEVNITIKKILNGYLLTLESGNVLYYGDLTSINEKIKDILEGF